MAWQDVTAMFPVDFQHVNYRGKIEARISQGDFHKWLVQPNSATYF
jgi:hypothetical protein